MGSVIEILREATRGTPYEGRLYLVGGYPRDRLLGLPAPEDVDIVLEGDALELARFLHEGGYSDHTPVLYPRFGTAMISIHGHTVEMVTARSEHYDAESRKPFVIPASLYEDARRRDFTVNTLLENLHTGKILDPLGCARRHLRMRLLKTPLPPEDTFFDDPLRMLRAVRLAVRLGFRIERSTWRAMRREAHRLNLMGPKPPVVSAERIRDEFVKILMSRDPARGLVLLAEAGLLEQFLPELRDTMGVTQNAWHAYDVWTHTVKALEVLPADAPLELRLAVLFHDIGKPATRTEDEKGVHFYEHQFVGAEITRQVLQRLHFPNQTIHTVTELVRLHMRLGEPKPDAADAVIRRLIRDTAPYLEQLFILAQADRCAMGTDAPVTPLPVLRARIEEVCRDLDAAGVRSPLDGREIMKVLNVAPGPLIGEAKEYLVNEVIEGRLKPGDREGAGEALIKWYHGRMQEKTASPAKQQG
ncbi:MAG: CCA tRNA nucleotidyltransferase [Chthonomonadales bacterium]